MDSKLQTATMKEHKALNNGGMPIYQTSVCVNMTIEVIGQCLRIGSNLLLVLACIADGGSQ